MVNAQPSKAVPGRKTEGKDRAWRADRLRHGLLHASFIPPQPIRELRELTRDRQELRHARTHAVTRLHKLLEGATLKLGAVATAILGTSGRDRLEAILAGVGEARTRAELARGRLRAQLPLLRQALEGRVQAHQWLLIQQARAPRDFLEEPLARLPAEIEEALAPLQAAVALRETLPGRGRTTATGIIAEIGGARHPLPSAGHLASWAGVGPGNRQSAGKRFGGKTRHGTTWRRALLGEGAWSIAHTSHTDRAAHYHRLARARRGGKRKAMVAVSHTVLVVMYHVLPDQRPSQDWGADYFDQLDTHRLQRHDVHRLEQLGYTVSLAPVAVA